MENQLLRDPALYPDSPVLRDALGLQYGVYEQFIAAISAPEIGLEHTWRYYNDGKAWLCKIEFRKKTVLWLSVWEGHFKTAFYFTDKHAEGIEGLPVAGEIKKAFREHKAVGKLRPLVMNVAGADQLNDLLAIIRFKKSVL
jgi:hypothetical protein